MAIYLDEMTRPYLERKFKNVADSDFVGKRIQDALLRDRQNMEDKENCEHVEAEYKGKKVCCGKCGAFYEEGMGFEWEKE